MTDHQLINQTSGKVEYYTPPAIINAARTTMGSIDLDPASSVAANRHVRAKRIFTVEHDGLTQSWNGNVWLNHPFQRGRNHLWINKAATAFKMRSEPMQICLITFASTSEAWFRPLLSFPQCFLHGRTNYFLPNGHILKGATKGSVVTYMGTRVAEFAVAFAPLGTVKLAFNT